MLTKSRGTIAACALTIAAVGGSVVIIRAASSGPMVAASAALPSPVGTATTATVPSSAGTGSGLNGTGSADSGPSNTGPGDAGTAGGQDPSPAVAAAAALSRSAGQGRPGPLPAGSLPADGAVPGASPALRALAAARTATTALPHSPRLLAELASRSPSASATATASASASASATTSASGSAGTGSASLAPTAQATNTTATGSPVAGAAGAAKAVAAGAPNVGTPTPNAGTAAASTASASGPTSVPGLDVAGYQHQNGDVISWSRVAAAGYRFAAVKGTEGDYYVNPWAAADLAQAKAAGFDVSPYHFAIPNASTGPQQAQYAVEYSGYATGGRMLPPTLDIEYDPYVSTDHTNECYGLTAGQMTRWIAGFVSQTRSLTGQYPIIYTTADWWDTCTGGSTAFRADPMWVAAYGFLRPPMPAGWPVWTYWQYTSGGTVPGVDSPGTTDLDVFSFSVIGLINPGGQASRLHAKVSVAVGSLGALAHEALTYSAAGLPPGLRIGANGVITGTVTSTVGTPLPKTYRVTLSARSASGARATVAFSWRVSPACQHSLANGVCPTA